MASVRKDQAPEAYRLHVLRHAAALAFLGAVVVIACVAALWSGSYATPLPQLLQGIFGAAEDPAVNTVVRSLRLPRICTALLGGAGLGAAGCVLQSVLRNPLASASTLGISQGAGFGAAFAIIVLGAGIQSSGSAAGGLTFTSPVTISLCAFVCSMAVSLLILALSRLRSVSAEAMVLAGVALSSLFSGASTLLQYFADEVQLASVVFWTFGDLGGTNWTQLLILLRRAMDAQPQAVESLASDEKIAAIMQYLSQHPTEPVSIDDLAARFYISKYHMMRQFRAQTGYTIHGYLTGKRLMFARAMIAAGTPVLQASEESGFGDYSAFLRAYRKQFGTTPNQEKRAN